MRIQLLKSKDNDIARLNEQQAALELQLYKLNKIISKDQKENEKLEKELKDKQQETNDTIKSKEYEKTRRVELMQNHDNWEKLV